MDTVDYDIEMRGLSAASRTIDAVALRDLLGALIDASGQVLRMSVEGTSTRCGLKPEWVVESTRFLITGLNKGSTIFPVQVPPLQETAREAVQQQDLWQSKPNGEWTALTLLGDALADVSNDNCESARYDSGVLSAIAGFGSVIQNVEVLTIRNKKTGDTTFNIRRRHIQQAKHLKQETPPSFSVVLSGKLDAIGDSQRSFKLKTDAGDVIRGVVQPFEVEMERLHDLWRKEVTIQGQAHFTPGGLLRSVEARVIRSSQAEDDFFKQSKTEIEAEAAAEKPLGKRDLSELDAGNDIKRARDNWPGDESIDEILDVLD